MMIFFHAFIKSFHNTPQLVTVIVALGFPSALAALK
jgi:hypothetical protein